MTCKQSYFDKIATKAGRPAQSLRGACLLSPSMEAFQAKLCKAIAHLHVRLKSRESEAA